MNLAPDTDERHRLDRLIEAEARAMALLDAIETEQLIAPGRSERAIELDIYALARQRFAVEKHWHKRIVRSGPNTLAIAAKNPPMREVSSDDIVFVDLGPVFEEWEADVGRSYAIGQDPAKHALVRELPRQFEAIRRCFLGAPDITGAELYAVACRSAAEAGWRFGGEIAGHVVGEFPHVRLYDSKHGGHIGAENPGRMRNPDRLGRVRHWIIEVHLIEPEGRWGGFYERLLLPG